MITDLFMNFVYGMLVWLINILPASTGFPPEVQNAFTTIGGYTKIFDPLIPWATMATCVALAFSVEIAIFGFKTLKWIISHVPIIGGKG